MTKLTLTAVVIPVGLLLALGLWLFALGMRNVARGVASSHWPRTAGKVVSSDTKESHDVDRKTRDVSVIYSANTVVQYRVDGKDYSTNLIHFGQTLGSGDASEAELQRLRYPVGGEVSVSYNLSQPWIAAARPGLHSEALLLPGGGLAFLLPGLLILFVFFNLYRNAPQQRRDDDDFRRSVETSMSMMERGIVPPDFKPPKEAPDMIMPVAAAFLGAVFAGLGLLGVWGGAHRLWRGHQSESWPTVEGKIVYSRVTGSDARDADNQRTTTFSPAFAYSYTVDNVQHFGNLRRFARIAGSGEDWAEDIAARYRLGKAVKVHYYAADPDVAVLEPGNDSEGLWLPGVALAALFFGLSVLIFLVPSLAK
jgi:hypothetical protein